MESDAFEVKQDDLKIDPVTIPDFTDANGMSPELIEAIKHSDMSHEAKQALTTNRIFARQIDFLLTNAMRDRQYLMLLDRRQCRIEKWKAFIWNRATFVGLIIGWIAPLLIAWAMEHFRAVK